MPGNTKVLALAKEMPDRPVSPSRRLMCAPPERLIAGVFESLEAQRTGRKQAQPVVKLKREIGFGGFARTILAEYEGDPFVVKIAREELRNSWICRECIELEGLVLSTMGQQGIPKGMYLGEWDGLPVLVMEYIENIPGWQHIAGLNTKLRIIRDATMILEHAHRGGIRHQDMKPENVLVEPNPQGQNNGNTRISEMLSQGQFSVVLIDFNLSKARKDADFGRHTSGEVAGTPEYVAPERVLGLEVDHRADIYSTGVMAYGAIAGELPFWGGPVSEIYQKHVQIKPDPPSSISSRKRTAPIPPELDEIVLRALAKNPEDRFQTALELAQAIDAFVLAHPEYAIERKGNGK